MNHIQAVTDFVKSTMAVPTWVKSWIGGEIPCRTAEKSESSLVVEALMSELDDQLKDAVKREKDNERTKQRREKGVDYSWLISVPVKHYRLSTMERLELEEMCSKVKPAESGNIIAKFREVLSREPSSREIPDIFRSCMKQVLDARPDDDGLTLVERVTRRAVSLTSLRMRTSTKVLPVNDEFEMKHVEDVTSRTKSLPDFNSREDILTV